MFIFDSNFTKTKGLALAIVAKRDEVTFTIIFSKDVNILLSPVI
jgi:hypothetical protein